MNVLVDGDVFTWQRHGGISRVYLELLPRLVALDSSVHIEVVLASAPVSDVLAALPVKLSVIPQIPPVRPLRRGLAAVNRALVDRHWKRCRADVFMSTYYTHPPVSCPSVCVVHDMVMEIYPELFHGQAVREVCLRKRVATKGAVCCICDSENTRGDLVRLFGIPEGNCRVIHLGCGAAFEQAADVGDAAADTQPFLLYVGDYVSPYKNFDFLLSALASATPAHQLPTRLVVVSPRRPEATEVNRYRALAGDLQLSFEDNCDDERLVLLYRTCAALIYPSLYEGFGIPLLEATYAGAPVVCADIAVFREVLGDLGYYFPAHDKAACVLAILHALTDGRKRVHVERRFQHASAFTWDRTAAAYLDVLRAVAAQPRMPRVELKAAS